MIRALIRKAAKIYLVNVEEVNRSTPQAGESVDRTIIGWALNKYGRRHSTA